MSDSRYNLVVIGAGAAGLVTSYIGAAVKAKVALVEKRKMGGDCLYTGCVPSKALIRTARLVAEMRRHQDYGIKSCDFSLDFPQIMQRVQRIIREIEPHDSQERYQNLGVECIQGEAQIIDPHTVQVGDRRLQTKNIVLAVGGAPLVPDIPGLSQVDYLTSENLWDLRTLPQRLLILGGGSIGCEMAMAFQRLGSQVTLMEQGPRLLPREDHDVAALIQERLEHEGVRVLTQTSTLNIKTSSGGGLQLVYRSSDGSENSPENAVAFDKILLAVGRRANTGALQALQQGRDLGIRFRPDGTIKVDAYLRANGRNIYACGDCVGPYQLTHVASHQAWYAAVNALFSPFKRFAVDYRVIPRVTFTDPEVAHVGHNEDSARAAGIAHEVTRYNMNDLDRAIAESDTIGFVKVLTVPGKDRILGASIVAPRAGEMIAEFVTAMKYGLGLNKILGTIHAYPGFVEANKYAAGNWKKAHAPQRLLKIVESFHRWRR